MQQTAQYYYKVILNVKRKIYAYINIIMKKDVGILQKKIKMNNGRH